MRSAANRFSPTVKEIPFLFYSNNVHNLRVNRMPNIIGGTTYLGSHYYRPEQISLAETNDLMKCILGAFSVGLSPS